MNEQQHTPTAEELLANEGWVAERAHLSRRVLEMVAEDQAERAARYFAVLAAQQGKSL